MLPVKPHVCIFLAALYILTVSGCSSDQNKESGKKRQIKDHAGVSLRDTLLNDHSDLSGTKNPDRALIPGISAGPVRINEDADSVILLLGKPDGGDAAMGKTIDVWYSNHDSTGYSTAIYTMKNMGNDETARVKQIRLTSPAYKTNEGLHTGSSLADIKKHFPVTKTETYRDAGTAYTVYDCDKGIAFEIAPDAKCVAVIIHESGTTGSGTYLKFRTTNRFIHPHQ